jgi:hypothetical protein
VDAITRRVMEHYDAGADHVCIQVFDVDPHGLPMRQWRELANAFYVGRLLSECAPPLRRPTPVDSRRLDPQQALQVSALRASLSLPSDVAAILMP